MGQREDTRLRMTQRKIRRLSQPMAYTGSLPVVDLLILLAV